MADGEAGRITEKDEAGPAQRLDVRPDEEGIGMRGVLGDGDAAERPAGPVRPRLQRAEARRRAQELAARHGSEHGRPLAGRAEPREDTGGRGMRDDDHGEGGRAAGELFDQHRPGPRVEAEPAVVLGGQRAEDAQLGEGTY